MLMADMTVPRRSFRSFRLRVRLVSVIARERQPEAGSQKDRRGGAASPIVAQAPEKTECPLAVRAVLRRAAPHLEERGLQTHLERIACPLRHPVDVPEVLKIIVVVARGDRRRQGAAQGGGDRRRTSDARQELTPTVTRGRGLCGDAAPPCPVSCLRGSADGYSRSGGESIAIACQRDRAQDTHFWLEESRPRVPRIASELRLTQSVTEAVQHVVDEEFVRFVGRNE